MKIFRRLFALLLVFIPTSLLITPFALAQSNQCDPSYVVNSFVVSALANNVDAWANQYQTSECEPQILTGVRTLASSFNQLSLIEAGTANNPCSQNGLLGSFAAAALSGEIETWWQNFATSDCPNATKLAASSLNDGYLRLLGQFSSRIAYNSDRVGNYEIYTMNSDGSEVSRLTNNSAYDGRADWSPDGQSIVFTSNRDGNNEIYVMAADGRNQRRLTNNSRDDNFPAYSPDGTQIAFNSDRDGDEEIYVMSADGTNQRQRTFNSTFDYWPTWSPDGSQLLFASGEGTSRDIYIMNADGSNRRRLTANSADDVDAAMSPDGATIAFISNRLGTYELYFMNVDGSEERLMSLPLGDKFHPDWNASGTQLVVMINRNRPVSRSGSFSGFDDGEWELYVLDSDGGNPTRITSNSFDDGDADWGG